MKFSKAESEIINGRWFKYFQYYIYYKYIKAEFIYPVLFGIIGGLLVAQLVS